MQLHCSHFSGKAAAFASRLGWTYMAAVLKQFQARFAALVPASFGLLSGVRYCHSSREQPAVA